MYIHHFNIISVIRPHSYSISYVPFELLFGYRDWLCKNPPCLHKKPDSCIMLYIKT